jgi:hypothetical protein
MARRNQARRKQMNKPENHHFFASSLAQWVTTNDERDLRDLLKIMEEDGYSYNLFLVPLPHDAEYTINFYQPQVKGTVWLGHFEGESK